MSRKLTGLIAAVAAVVGGLIVVSGALASPASIAVGSATVGTNEQATVALSVTPEAAEQVGALTIDITYPAGLTIVSCTNTAAAAAACNTDFGGTGDTIRYTLAGTDPVSGDIANIVATSDTVGTYDLTVNIVTCADIEGTDLTTCTSTNGAITVVQATPTPTPTPSPTPSPTPVPATPTPTATPAGLPQTGGTSSDGSSSEILWVLGTLGLAVLAGGVWAVSRARRQSV